MPRACHKCSCFDCWHEISFWHRLSGWKVTYRLPIPIYSLNINWTAWLVVTTLTSLWFYSVNFWSTRISTRDVKLNFFHNRWSLCNNRWSNLWHLSRDEKIGQTDSVSVVLFMLSMGGVLLAAYSRWGWHVYMTHTSNGRNFWQTIFRKLSSFWKF